MRSEDELLPDVLEREALADDLAADDDRYVLPVYVVVFVEPVDELLHSFLAGRLVCE